MAGLASTDPAFVHPPFPQVRVGQWLLFAFEQTLQPDYRIWFSATIIFLRFSFLDLYPRHYEFWIGSDLQPTKHNLKHPRYPALPILWPSDPLRSNIADITRKVYIGFFCFEYVYNSTVDHGTSIATFVNRVDWVKGISMSVVSFWIIRPRFSCWRMWMLRGWAWKVLRCLIFENSTCVVGFFGLKLFYESDIRNFGSIVWDAKRKRTPVTRMTLYFLVVDPTFICDCWKGALHSKV